MKRGKFEEFLRYHDRLFAEQAFLLFLRLDTQNCEYFYFYIIQVYVFVLQYSGDIPPPFFRSTEESAVVIKPSLMHDSMLKRPRGALSRSCRVPCGRRFYYSPETKVVPRVFLMLII